MAIERAAGTAEIVTVHALGWLVIGNGVGALLALLLLLPEANAPLAPLTYGRWMPVHWNTQLYGWSALPLVGLLLRVYRGYGRGDRWGRLAVSAWSAMLLVGAATWLAGRTTGKPFLEWSGVARWFLLATLVLLAAVLGAGLVGGHRPAPSRDRIWAAKAVLLVTLLAVPVAMAHATSPATYPPVNPASGGPTGVSLLGSTLGIVALFVAAPYLLGLRADGPKTRATVALLAVHGGLFLLLLAIDGGDRSHHDALQLAAVASLAVWPPVLVAYLRRFRWPTGTGRWLGALAGWGVFLTASALLTFLPGVLERWKFTNALVAHAHLAMAGLVSSFAVLVLMGLTREGVLASTFRGGRAFVLWHGGCLAFVVSMLVLGTLEGADPGVVIRASAASTTLYAVRLAAGVTMLAASIEWLGGGLRRLARVGWTV